MIQVVEAPTPGIVQIVSAVPSNFSFEFNEVAATLDVYSTTEVRVTSSLFGKVIVRADSVDYPGRYGKVEINFLVPLTITVL